MTSDEIKQRGIEFLLSQREKDKQPHELSAVELAPILKIHKSSVYDYMAPLVEKGLWATRYAYDEEMHREIKVWWFIG